MKLKLAIGDEEKEIAILRQEARIQVTFDGITRELTVLQHSGALTVVAYDDAQGRRRVLRLAGTDDGAARRIWVNGQTLRYAPVGRQAAGRGAAPGSLSADIPAVVSEILVAPGDTVAAGDPLLASRIDENGHADQGAFRRHGTGTPLPAG